MKTKSVEFVKVKLVNDFTLKSEKVLKNPRDVLSLVLGELGQYDREVFAVINLTNKGKPINVNICHIGTINQSIAHPREILKSSVLSNAASVIFVHNHPSGDLEPSPMDKEVTKVLANAYKLLNIKPLDHIICTHGKDHYYSMREDPFNYELGELFENDNISYEDSIDIINKIEDMENKNIEEELGL
ncbi:JAB domain-containing protein [Breznakia pachnodae]|uniref:DNA repair protein RadC n=1 Tax=Breznakia pachnodae TaxID=265178 RepID=A0ABU0E3U9_9FIRM|nr:JAB domain-containing protein [Breznakia pachnodae]MDQ0361577.1 DNA repair protein RadC [Breznakia pachnodae]